MGVLQSPNRIHHLELKQTISRHKCHFLIAPLDLLITPYEIQCGEQLCAFQRIKGVIHTGKGLGIFMCYLECSHFFCMSTTGDAHGLKDGWIKHFVYIVFFGIFSKGLLLSYTAA